MPFLVPLVPDLFEESIFDPAPVVVGALTESRLILGTFGLAAWSLDLEMIFTFSIITSLFWLDSLSNINFICFSMLLY